MRPGDPIDAMEFMKGMTFDEVYRLRHLIRHWHSLNQRGIYPPLPGPDSEDLTPEEHAALGAVLEQKAMAVTDRSLGRAIETMRPTREDLRAIETMRATVAAALRPAPGPTLRKQVSCACVPSAVQQSEAPIGAE